MSNKMRGIEFAGNSFRTIQSIANRSAGRSKLLKKFLVPVVCFVLLNCEPMIIMLTFEQGDRQHNIVDVDC